MKFHIIATDFQNSDMGRRRILKVLYPKDLRLDFEAISYKSDIIELAVGLPPAPSPSKNNDCN